MAVAACKLGQEGCELDLQMAPSGVILQVLQRHGTASADIVGSLSMELHAPSMVMETH